MRQPTLTIGDVSELPAVMEPGTWAEKFGFSRRYVQLACQRGDLPCRKVGGRYFINVKKSLEMFGLTDADAE